jgi:NAD(P)-dependent dehydrogenase (short-subunit alcohol dehydrogenase family)
MADQQTLLITGAAGFVGSHLVGALVDGAAGRLGVERVVATDIRELPRGLGEHDEVEFRRLDIRDREAVVELFEEFEPSRVVHLAAVVTPPPGDHRQLQYEVDVEGTRHVIEGCLAVGTEHFVYTSSGAAYGYQPDNPVPLHEDDPLRGNEAFAYAHHKRIVEQDLARARREHPELKQLIFRVSTVLGPSTNNQITDLFEQPVVTGVRGAASPFCVIADEDVVGAIVHGLAGGEAGVYNLSGDGVLTLETIAERMGGRYVAMPETLVRAALGGLSALGVGAYGPEQVLFLKHRPVLDNRRLVEELGYRPRYTSEEAFERYRRARRPDADDRVVVLTGAGGGLGYALARVHASRGHNLVLLDNDEAALERTYMMVRAQGGEAIRRQADVCSEDDCHEAVRAAERAFGGVDVLYNNAAIGLRSFFHDSDAAEVAKVLDVNFLGAVRMTQAALRLLRRRAGRIAVISSVAGFAPLTGRTAYAASKHALHGFFGSLRSELLADGVSISLVCPGYLNTGFREDAADGASELDVDQAAEAIVEAVQTRRRMLLVGRTAKLAWWVRRIAPTVFERLMRRSVKDEFPT